MSTPTWHKDDDPCTVRNLLARSGILAIPTESSYGLAVDPRSAEAVDSVYRVKLREGKKPLPLVVADKAQAEAFGLDIEHPAFRYGERFWPAPLSVIVPLASGVLALGAEVSTAAVRIPAHDALLRLLTQLGHGLTATSANLAGEPPLFEPIDVRELLAGRDAMVMVGASVGRAPPSTVVAWADRGPWILRAGAFKDDSV